MASSIRLFAKFARFRCGSITNKPKLIPAGTKLNLWTERHLNSFRSRCSFRDTGTARAVLTGTTWAAFFGLWKPKEEELSENDRIRKLVSAGIVARDNGDFQQSGKKFHEALSLSTDFHKENRVTKEEHLNHRVFIYDQIANLSMDIGDLKAAEIVFKETMKLALQLGMDENDNAIIEMSLKLASIYLYTGRDKLAAQGFTHCITEQEKKLNATATDTKEDATMSEEEVTNTRILLGKAYKNYANNFLQKRDFKRAEPLILKALEISKDTLGSGHDNTFVIINDLATCQIMMQNYDKAEDMLKDGIVSSHRSGSLMESALCSNLGALYIRTKRYSEARVVCEKGLRVAEKGDDSYLMGPCKACLAKLAELKGENK